MSFFASNHYFNPRQLGGLVLWIDSSDPSANGVQPANNTSVATWVDKSAQGNNATQATGANQPTFVTSGLNSKPSFSTNASTSMNITTTGFSTGSTGRTGFNVITQSSGTGDPGMQYGNTNISSWGISGIDVGGGPILYCGIFNAYETGSTTLTSTTPYVLELNYPGGGVLSTQTGKINGTDQTMTANGSNPVLTTNTNTPNIIFGAVGSYFAALLLYNTSLTATQANLLRKYLGNKWGITVS